MQDPFSAHNILNFDLSLSQAKGANVTTALNQDYAAKTPLHAAARRGHINVIRLLLDLGVDVNVKDAEGNTPLAEAWDGGRDLAAMMLQENGGVE